MSTKLPIDIIPNTRPQRFKWHTRGDILTGARAQDFEATLPAYIEKQVMELIALVKRQQEEIETLKSQLAQYDELESTQSPPANKSGNRSRK